ncbi:hypothetical protein [Sphingosinicella sp.]|uniref:hypothetical protein n=1 Tax=Sphingosinicella sp. TaxID=1917971 RepID=UPI0040379AC1
MKRLLLVAALAITMMPPLRAQPAAAPSDAPFTCLFEGVTAAQRALAGPAASQRLTDAPADGEQRGGTALDAILAALPRCADAGRWTATQRDMAQHYVLAQLGREDMRRRYAAQNVDLSFLDGGMVAAGGSPPSFEQLVARVRAQGVTGQRPDRAEDIVFIYLEMAGQAEAMKSMFADRNLNGRR